MKLAFIGGGVMAEAIMGGILAKEMVPASDISVGELVEERRDALKSKHSVYTTADNLEATKRSDMIILAIKPQTLPQIFSQLKEGLQPSQTVLSIIAGTPVSTIVDGLDHAAVIRVMPNTPSQIGEGMTMWTCSPQVGDAARELTQSILQTMGEEIYVSDEKYLDMATALSASGPAYVFLFIEALVDAGVHIGLPREVAQTMALQTVLGSSKLAKDTGLHPAQLKNMVTSPGGTTAEALLALEEGGFRSSVLNAVIAAYHKSIQLGAR